MLRKDVVEEFCRDLKSYLEEALRFKRMHVVVRVGKLAKLRGDLHSHKRIGYYRIYLAQLFDKYKFATGMYTLPREVAEDTYKNIDALCETLKKRRRKKRSEVKKIEREKMVLISFHVPPPMLRDLDKVAKILGKTRSEIIREAIRRMLKTYMPEEKNATEERHNAEDVAI